MAMAIYEVTLVGGEVARMRADFAQAACNIEYQCGDAVGTDEWSNSQYQVADARHRVGQAVELVFATDGDEVESYSELERTRETVDLGAVETDRESIAVARGQAVRDALESADEALLDTDGTDGDEAVWSELVQYLERRGITVAYDHDAGYPIARK